MDWQHLIMNGESLAEYAALLAAEGLLGHQHANSGWGTFDDDNMVGATAFMETLELAVELRRAGYGDNGERLGFDLYPYTEDAVAAVAPERAAVALHRRRSRRGSTTPRCARRSREGRGPRVRARLRRARRLSDDRAVGLDVGTTGVKALAVSPDGRGRSRAPSAGYPLSTPQPGLGRAGSRGLVARGRGGARASLGRPRGRRDRPLRPDARARRARRRATGVLRPAILWNDQRTAAECARDRGARRARAPDRADRQPRADRLHRAEAPLAAPPRAGGVRADRARPAARRTTSACG